MLWFCGRAAALIAWGAPVCERELGQCLVGAGEHIPPPSVPIGSTLKSRVASVSGFSKVVYSSFSESACWGFINEVFHMFLECPTSVDQRLLLLDVSKEGSRTKSLGKRTASLRRLMGWFKFTKTSAYTGDVEAKEYRGDNPTGCVLSLSCHCREGFKCK